MNNSEKPESQKRFVSWAAYFKHLGVKTGASVFAMILYGFGAIGLLMALVCLFASVFSRQEGSLIGLIGFGVIGALSSVLVYYGRVAHREVREIPRLEPITKKNIVEMPPQETLVRGSSEPVSPQKEVLLRPAQGAPAAQEQELLLPR